MIQLGWEALYNDYQDMLVLSSTTASHYYKCRTDTSIILGNYGYY
jgi:hypothetical protein